MAIKCKRIIDGKTYNTETATQISGWDDDDGPFTQGRYLYQTRFGAFFLYTYLEGAGEDDYERIEPFTPDKAREWLEFYRSYEVETIERLFGEMPEAEDDDYGIVERSLRERGIS